MSDIQVIHFSCHGLLGRAPLDVLPKLKARWQNAEDVKIRRLSSYKTPDDASDWAVFEVVFADADYTGSQKNLELVLTASQERVLTRRAVLMPAEKPSTSVRACVDFVEINGAAGWAIEEGDQIAPRVELWAGDYLVAATLAEAGRPDLYLEGLTRSPRGFKFNDLAGKWLEIPEKVTVKINGRAFEKNVAAGKSRSMLSVSQISHYRLRIELDHIEPHLAHVDADIDIQVAGLSVDKLTCRCERGSGHVDYSVPHWLRDGRQHVFEVKMKDSGLSAFMVWSDPRLKMSIISATENRVVLDLGDLNATDLPELYMRDTETGQRYTRINVTPGMLSADPGTSDTLVIDADFRSGSVARHLELRSAVNDSVWLGVSIGFGPHMDLAARAEVARQAQNGVVRHPAPALTEKVDTESRGKKIASLSAETQSYYRACLDFTCLAKQGPEEFDRHRQTLCVVVPVYDGHVETFECLQSILNAKNETPYRLVVVNDCTPDSLLQRYLDSLALESRSHVTVMKQSKNSGFTASANLGIAFADGADVILLNADTVVCDGWLDRFTAVAEKHPHAGTITPLSNNGELANVPYLSGNRGLDDVQLVQAFDQAAWQANKTDAVAIPVGIGFCLYIRRSAIDAVGVLREDVFGRGYGEEVDFCLRLADAGWSNVLAGGIFVMHKGGVSFGEEKIQRTAKSAKTLMSLYPFYDAMIMGTLKQDPMRPLRRRTNLALLKARAASDMVLHISHDYGGGTRQYVDEIASLYSDQQGLHSIILGVDSAGNIRLDYPTAASSLHAYFNRLHTEFFERDAFDELLEFLESLPIRKSHLHAPFGLSAAQMDKLLALAPYDATVHDFAWICPRVNMVPGGDIHCGEPDTATCNACISLNPVHDGLSDFLREAGSTIEGYRARMQPYLSGAKRLYVGGKDVKARLKKQGQSGRFVVRPHPDLESRVTYRPSRNPGPLTVAIIGGISKIKGSAVLQDVLAYVDQHGLPVRFVLFGYTDNAALLEKRCLTVTGRYSNQTIDALLADHQPALAFFPNRWPETYSYTLSLALRAGLWPVVSDLGVPAERVEAAGVGTVFPHDADAEAIAATLFDAHKEFLRGTPSVPARLPLNNTDYLN